MPCPTTTWSSVHQQEVQDQPRGVPGHAGGRHPRAGGPGRLDQEAIHDALIALAEQLEVKNATLMWPVRIAAAGKAVTPGGAVEICHVLGKEETLRRLRPGAGQAAIDRPVPGGLCRRGHFFRNRKKQAVQGWAGTGIIAERTHARGSRATERMEESR